MKNLVETLVKNMTLNGMIGFTLSVSLLISLFSGNDEVSKYLTSGLLGYLSRVGGTSAKP